MKTTLTVHGMGCAACEAKVRQGLVALPGVSEVAVTLGTGRVAVTHDPAVAPALLAETVTSLGYQVEEAELVLSVEGMNCASCVANVESAVKGLPGVTDVAVSLGTGTARVHGYAGVLRNAPIIEAIVALGYKAGEKLEGRLSSTASRRSAPPNSAGRSATCGSSGRWWSSS